MKKIIFISFVLVSLTSFTLTKPASHNTFTEGTFGVCCDCEDTPEKITVQLKLNADQSFQYIDNTHSEKKIHITGHWEKVKNRIVFSDYPNGIKFHNNWKIDTPYNCIKAHKGLSFYRLCNLNTCGE